MNITVLGIGIVMLAVGIIYPVLTLKHQIACKGKVVATVVKVETKRHYSGDRKTTKYLPTFSYTIDGKTYTTESDLETMNMLKYKEGNEVTIRYNPNAPETICVGIKVFPYVAGILFILMGSTFLVCSFL